MKENNVLNDLYETILERKEDLQEGSYTSYLFEKGLDKILKKVGEESTEMIIASKNSNSEEIVNETCDLIYHMLVLLAEKGIKLEQVNEELLRRRKKINNKKEERKKIVEY
ncbi:phosphoribosyl-ATP diphosphatase [Clostridium sp. DL1XJH146]